jgi:hypothetical protein
MRGLPGVLSVCARVWKVLPPALLALLVLVVAPNSARGHSKRPVPREGLQEHCRHRAKSKPRGERVSTSTAD